MFRYTVHSKHKHKPKKKTPAAALIEKTIFSQLSTKIETPTRSIFSLPPHPPHKQIHLDTLRVFNSI